MTDLGEGAAPGRLSEGQGVSSSEIFMYLSVVPGKESSASHLDSAKDTEVRKRNSSRVIVLPHRLFTRKTITCVSLTTHRIFIMIISLTPNPALDVSGLVERLTPNEKSYVTQEMRLPGGNGINAARIAQRLGSKVIVTGFLGGASGAELSLLLKSEKISQKFIDIRGRTRTNVTISLEKSHQQTRLSFPGPKIQASEKKKLLTFLRSKKPTLVLIGGSLPQGISNSFIKSLITANRALEIPTFLDVPGKNLKEIISARPVFIKPNLTEFQDMTGTRTAKLKDVLKIARRLSPMIPLQCISSVEGGALLVTKEHAWFGKIPKIKVESTVGAGDSMVGGMAHSFMKGRMVMSEKSCELMLRTGLAAACATLSHKGLTLGTRPMITHFLPKIQIIQID